MDVPRIGRVVIYRSRTGSYSCPAIITATRGTLHRGNVAEGHVVDLTDAEHVHLNVFTPGLPGHVSASTARDYPELAASQRPVGMYQEFDVPFWPCPPGADADTLTSAERSPQPPRTWTWPVRG